MDTGLQNFWTEEVRVDVVSPSAILKAQVTFLEQRTKGLLNAEVNTISTETGQVLHQFDLVAPVLFGYRYRILTAQHAKEFVYPVDVQFVQNLGEPFRGSDDFWLATCGTDQEFISVVKRIFQSSSVLSVIQSLIARSNEAKNPQASIVQNRSRDEDTQ